MPAPAGNAMNIYLFVDANHAGNVIIQRSHTDILTFYPITWLSRGQNIVETSTFGSECVTLQIATDLIISLHSE